MRRLEPDSSGNEGSTGQGSQATKVRNRLLWLVEATPGPFPSPSIRFPFTRTAGAICGHLPLKERLSSLEPNHKTSIFPIPGGISHRFLFGSW